MSDSKEIRVCIWFIRTDGLDPTKAFVRKWKRTEMNGFGIEWQREGSKSNTYWCGVSRCWLARTLCSCALKLNHFLFRAFDFFEKEFVLFLCCWHSPLYGSYTGSTECAAMCACVPVPWHIYLFPSSQFSMHRVLISQRLSEIDLRMNRWQQQRRWRRRRRRQTFPKKKKREKILRQDQWCVFLLFIFLNFCQLNVFYARIRILYLSISLCTSLAAFLCSFVSIWSWNMV